MKKQTITFTAILLTLGCFAFLSQMQAVTPAPDGCYPGFTTAEGCNALQHLTSGAGNTGVGWRSLFSNSTGSFNTAIGAGALVLNNGDSNTAVGAAALLLNAGSNNTALGANAGTDPGILSNNIYVGDTGFGGDNSVIAIGGLAASGTPYVNCYIGGIVPQSQGTDGVTVCEVTVRLADGRLGIDCTHPSNPGSVPDSAPLRRSGPQQPHAHPAMPNGTVGQVEKLEAAVAEQQKQIETLTAQLKEQATQFTAQLKSNDAKQEATIAKQQRRIESLTARLERVSARLETSKPAPQVVANP